MNTTSIEVSRAFGVAESLRAEPLSEDEVRLRPVLLCGEAAALNTANGRWCFENCLRLLARIVGPLTVELPETSIEFEEHMRGLASSLFTLGSITVRHRSHEGLGRFVAILNVGSGVRPELPWTTVNSNAWTARATSGGKPLPEFTGEDNPFAAMLAASLGVAEVFKRVYSLPSDTAPLLERTQFSLFDFEADPRQDGPPLPKRGSLPDTVVVGAGAIGNGIVLLLSQLDWSGRIHLIDYQHYGEENKGTCVLLDDPGWIDTPKAKQLANWLDPRSSLQVTWESAKVADARSGESIGAFSVDLVLNALDDVGARHDAQLLWPSVLIDGGINPAGCAVVTHRLDQPQAACMRCMFELPREDHSVAQQAATGLTADALQDLEQLLSDADIELAAEDIRPWLREMQAQGKTRCAVVGEAMSKRLGANFEPSFRPSVPFVATAAAALVLGQAAKSLFYPGAQFTHHFQIESLFRGPSNSASTLRRANPKCICVTQRNIIERLQRGRRHAAGG